MSTNFRFALISLSFWCACAPQPGLPGSLDTVKPLDMALAETVEVDSAVAKVIHDLSISTSDVDAASPADGACLTYGDASVATMRQGKSGCYRLSNVISIGLTPSSKSPTLFVQDGNGGAYSAVQTKCSSTSTAHPCTVAADVHSIAVGHSVTLQGTYIKAMGGFEEFYIDTVSDNGAATTTPNALTLGIADVAKGSTQTAAWFQRVSVTLASADTLLPYSLSPPELQSTYNGVPSTSCPYWYGFSLIPKSAKVTAGALCSGTTQPSAAASKAAEILIGTDFYDGFTASSDCACASKYGDKLVTSTSTLSGKLQGILIFDSPIGGTGYQYVAPQADTDAPISNLK